MRIAMVSEHASPLAALGGVDAGGQNVHVAALSAALARRGHDIRVYTRRDDPALPDRVRVQPRLEVVHVNAGPPCEVPKDELLPFMGDLAAGIGRDLRAAAPDIVHAHFWMSGLAALEAAGGRHRPTGPCGPNLSRTGHRQAAAPGARQTPAPRSAAGSNLPWAVPRTASSRHARTRSSNSKPWASTSPRCRSLPAAWPWSSSRPWVRQRPENGATGFFR